MVVFKQMDLRCLSFRKSADGQAKTETKLMALKFTRWETTVFSSILLLLMGLSMFLEEDNCGRIMNSATMVVTDDSIQSRFAINQSWIRLVGLPLHLWSQKVFKAVGDFCGGWVKTGRNRTSQSPEVGKTTRQEQRKFHSAGGEDSLRGLSISYKCGMKRRQGFSLERVIAMSKVLGGFSLQTNGYYTRVEL